MMKKAWALCVAASLLLFSVMVPQKAQATTLIGMNELTTSTFAIAINEDDAWGEGANWYPYWTAHFIGNYYGAFCTSAYRWQLDIPQSSVITAAHIDFASAGNWSDTVNLKLRGIDEGNTANFTTDPRTRPTTTATVDWDITAEWENMTYHESPDIKEIIQEIVTRSDWVSSNSLGILLADDDSPDSNYRAIVDFGDDVNKPAVLNVTYAFESTPPVITVFSPQNQTYDGRIVPLNFTIYDYSAISWMGYSLDGQANTTVTDNITLNVNAGSHNVVVYANDTYGNMGFSDVVYFSSLGGCVVVKVQYLDGYPRSGADVFTVPPPEPAHSLGTTNESGLTVTYGVLSPGDCEVGAYYPVGIQFGPPVLLTVDENGNGMRTITASYEITPSVIEVLSPQNLTYTDGSVPLTFAVQDYSPISWIGYSLDNQPNVTVADNTTLTELALGSHNVVVFANDTFGNMGASERVYFTVAILDIAVTNAAPFKTVVGQGFITFINVTIQNQGTITETFNVTVYANTTIIETEANITLTSGNSATLTFTWNTSGFAKGNYTIRAYAWPVPGESDTSDNNRIDGTVLVTIPGDVNGDKKVEGKDIAVIAKYFGSIEGFPPNADIDSDGKVDGRDIAIAAQNFGKTWP